MVPVGYRDFAPALQDLTTGRLHVAATGVPSSFRTIKQAPQISCS